MIYTAPPKKPRPNIATVSIPYELALRGDEKYGGQRGMFTAHITIVDGGYKATGSSHDVVYSGDVCDVEKPFTVRGTGLANFDLKFVPSSATSGTVSYTAVYNVPGLAIKESSDGTYKLVGDGADGFDILVDIAGTAHTSRGDFSGDGGVKIHLTPGAGDCTKK